MPALSNPRHEAFAQALFAGLSKHQNYSQGRAYIEAGYKATPESARRCASRLLTFADGVAERIHELQQQQLARITPKLDVSKKTIGRRLRLASEMAEQDRNPSAMATCELGLAKVFHSINDNETQQVDYNTAQSMTDIGRKLLQSIGFASPDDASIQEAVALNDTFVDGLQAIYERAQALTLEQR